MQARPKAWQIPRDWQGQTAFVLGSGPSATAAQILKLRGQRLVVINSSWTVAPFADVLFFADSRWWQEFGEKTKRFRGQIITTCNTAKGDPRVLWFRKDVPPKITDDKDSLVRGRTSLAAGIDYCRKRGASPIVLLGADGRVGLTGRRHNHDQTYPWPLAEDSFERQCKELANLAKCWRKAGAIILNASPGSRFDMFPSTNLDAHVAHTPKDAASAPDVPEDIVVATCAREPAPNAEAIQASRLTSQARIAQLKLDRKFGRR